MPAYTQGVPIDTAYIKRFLKPQNISLCVSATIAPGKELSLNDRVLPSFLSRESHLPTRLTQRLPQWVLEPFIEETTLLMIQA